MTTRQDAIEKTVIRARGILKQHYNGHIKGYDCVITETVIDETKHCYGFHFEKSNTTHKGQKTLKALGSVQTILCKLEDYAKCKKALLI